MTEKISIPTSNGKKLAAAIHHSDKVTDKLAILCPGYLDTKDYDHIIGLADTLTNEGYTAVRFDPLGTWGSEGTIAEYTTSQYLKDIRSVIDYILQKEDFKYILLGGHSKGGMVSMLYAIQDARVSIVLAIMSPSTLIKTIDSEKLKTWERAGIKVSRRNLPGSHEEKEFHVPYSHQTDARQYNVLNDIQKLHKPLILVAGELDDVVPARDMQLIFDKANDPKKFLVVKGIGHDYRHNTEEIKKINETILGLLDK